MNKKTPKKSDKHECENGEVEMDKKDLIKEHKRLVKILKSPSHKDDLTEAQKQVRELKGYQRMKCKKD